MRVSHILSFYIYRYIKVIDIRLQNVKHMHKTEEVRETEVLTLVFSISEEENNSTSKVTLAITHTFTSKAKSFI